MLLTRAPVGGFYVLWSQTARVLGGSMAGSALGWGGGGGWEGGGGLVVSQVYVWRGWGSACMVIGGYSIPLALAVASFMLCPTHYQERTRRTLLSPSVGYRFVIAAAALLSIIQHLRNSKRLLSADAPAPVTVCDEVGVLTMVFAISALGCSALQAQMLQDWIYPDAPKRREQDYNRRVMLLVSIMDDTMLTAFPLCYIAMLQFIVHSSSLHLHHTSPLTFYSSTEAGGYSEAASAAASAQKAKDVAAEEAVVFGLSAFALVMLLLGAVLQVAFGARKYFDSKRADLRRQFELFDTDASGDLSIEELLVALENYGYEDYEQAMIMVTLLGDSWHAPMQQEIAALSCRQGATSPAPARAEQDVEVSGTALHARVSGSNLVNMHICTAQNTTAHTREYACTYERIHVYARRGVLCADHGKPIAGSQNGAANVIKQDAGARCASCCPRCAGL